MAAGSLSRTKRFRAALRVCLVSAGITVLLLMAVFALRGIWPFGEDNVAYADTAQFYVPDYYQLWDAMHGEVSINLNWFAGLGEGSSASLADFLKPANWVFLFIPRDHVLEGLSLYLAVRMAIIALAAALVLGLRFPLLGAVRQTAFALLYTFSGFTLQYYANFSWLSYVALFPLLLFALERLLRDGKYGLYALIYAYYLYNGVYFTYMVTIYIMLFSLCYCVFLLPRERRGNHVLRLGLSTAAAYGVTAYYWLGSSSSLAGTSRFESNMDSGLMTGLTTWNLPNTRHTTLMLLGMAAVLVLLLRALTHQRFAPAERKPRRKRIILFFSCVLGALFVPMVFTNIDTAWHFGQYNFFPMRYGYMLPATLLAAAALVLEEEARFPAPPRLDTPRRSRLRLAGICAAALCLALLLPRLDSIFKEYGACFLTSLGTAGYFRYFALYVLCGLLFAGLYFLLFRLKNRRAALWLTAGALLLQIGSNAYGLIAPSDDHTYTREYDPSYIETADSLYEYFSEQNISPLARVKNVDSSLNAGYPSIAGVSALSSVNSNNSSTKLGVFRELGYTVNYFRVMDTGGTVFSDMLLGVQYILSAAELDESLYTPGDTVDGIQIGTARYPGVIGLMYNTDALADYFEYNTLAERLNALYWAFTDSETALAQTAEPDIATAGEGLQTYTLTCNLDGSSFLYISSTGSMMNITAGGQSVSVPSYQNLDNIIYPATFNSNLLYLGCFDGTVEIQFSSSSGLTADDVTITALDKAALDDFYTSANLDTDAVLETTDDGLTITLTADSAGQNLFLPLMASSRWRCTVNGEEVTPATALGVFMSIPLQEGENTVTLIRGPVRVSVGPSLIGSVVCLVLVILWLILRRRPRLQAVTIPKPVLTLAQGAFYAASAAVLGFVYIVPIVLLLVQGTVVWF